MGKALMLGMIAAATAGAAHAQSGSIVSRNYPVGGFDRVDSAGPYHIEVRTGARASVSASGPVDLIDRMVVEVRNGELEIHPRRERLHINRDDGRRVNLLVTVPRLRGAELAGSGDIIVDQVRGTDFDGSVAGSGNLVLQSLDVGTLRLSVAGSGDARTGRGRARSLDISVAGSGNADTRGTATPSATISIAGSGKASAYASQIADISIAGSGDAEVTGGARCTVSRVGSGRARCS